MILKAVAYKAGIFRGINPGAYAVGSFDPALLRGILPGAEGYELVAMINVGYPAPESQPSPMHEVRKAMDDFLTKMD